MNRKENSTKISEVLAEYGFTLLTLCSILLGFGPFLLLTALFGSYSQFKLIRVVVWFYFVVFLGIILLFRYLKLKYLHDEVSEPGVLRLIIVPACLGFIIIWCLANSWPIVLTLLR